MQDIVVEAEGGTEETSLMSSGGLALLILLCQSISPLPGKTSENRQKIPEPRRIHRASHENHDGYRWSGGGAV